MQTNQTTQHIVFKSEFPVHYFVYFVMSNSNCLTRLAFVIWEIDKYNENSGFKFVEYNILIPYLTITLMIILIWRNRVLQKSDIALVGSGILLF